MRDEAIFCGKCGAKFDDYIGKGADKTGRPDAGGLTLGDTGMIKGDITNAPASVGGVHIHVPSRDEPTVPKRALEKHHCPVCGRVILEGDRYYLCPQCERDYVCEKDYNESSRACVRCASERIETGRESSREPQGKTASATPLFQDPPEPGETRTFAGIEFVWIPPGTFEMGWRGTRKKRSTKTERASEEFKLKEAGQVHTVRISKGFWMGKYEVTKGEWESVMGTEPWLWVDPNTDDFVLEHPRAPVEYVTWHDAQDFISELNQLNAKGEGHFRLPTEAEWEYACRAGTQTEFYYGDDPEYSRLKHYAWYCENIDECCGQLVGQKEPNAWGLYDMHGNLYEWCEDWYDDAYYSKSPATDPQGPATGANRVLRGGDIASRGWGCGSASRGWADPAERSECAGFRFVRDSD